MSAFQPKRPCKKPGCSALLGVGEGTYCAKHRTAVKVEAQVIDRWRGTAAERGYGYRWGKARKIFLAQNPLCRMCAALGVTTLANTVDHIIPHKGNQALFWDQANWQPVCKKCHDKKTAREDRGAWVPQKPVEAGCV